MKLEPKDLLSLEEYDSERESIKKELISHKKNRTISIGDNIVLIFEDFMTIKYQVQEMLRIEKIFNKKEIQEEIDAYNPLIPVGTNLKATMLIMFPDVEVRIGVDHPEYNKEIVLDEIAKESLQGDLKKN